MPSDSPVDESSVLSRVLEAGVEAVGEAYARQCRLSPRGATTSWTGPGRDDWVIDAIYVGEDLPADVYFEVILAAIRAGAGDANVLWCIADGPVDHLVGRDPRTWAQRFHDAREIPAVEEMFQVMLRSLRQKGCAPGWWDGER